MWGRKIVSEHFSGMAEFRFKAEIKPLKFQQELEKITVLSTSLRCYDNTGNKFTIIITTDNTSWANRTKISSKPVLGELIILTFRCQELGISQHTKLVNLLMLKIGI